MTQSPARLPGTPNYVGYVCTFRKLSFPTCLLAEFITTWPIRKQAQRGGLIQGHRAKCLPS